MHVREGERTILQSRDTLKGHEKVLQNCGVIEELHILYIRADERDYRHKAKRQGGLMRIAMVNMVVMAMEAHCIPFSFSVRVDEQNTKVSYARFSLQLVVVLNS